MLARVARTLAALAVVCAPGFAVAGPALLFDLSDGRILYAEDQDNQWHPASLTKIMTAYVVFTAIKAGKLKLEDRITFSELAVAEPPSKIGLVPGATMTVDKALQALVVKSANDVALALAETTSGSLAGFVEQMNATAKRLGMSRTNFVNANGLPAPEQVTTARDLGRLARAIVRDFPEYAALWQQSDVQIGRKRLRTHNGLLRTYDGADGLKTGFICDSGYNVVATATREQTRLVAVVLGEPSGRDRSVRAAGLMEHGFQTGAWKAALGGTQSLDSLPLAEFKGPVSVRDLVVAWDCGRRGRVRAVAKSQKKRQEIKAGATASAAAATKAATSPKPKTAKPAEKSAAVGPDGTPTPKPRPRPAAAAKPAAKPETVQ